MAFITCNQVSLAYDGRIAAEDITFTVQAGDYLCIVGENGSGKSTLIKGLLGLKQPLSGSISYGDGLTRHSIGYLPQQTDVQRDFPASVYEVVLSGHIGQAGLFYTRKQKNQTVSVMEKLGIRDLANRCYRELSGGQQQRVRLARALCATQKMLLLDEPTSGLDPLVSAEMYGLIERLNREDHVTIIMVSHDTGTPIQSATHILHLKQTPLFFGSREDYLASGIGKTFLGGNGHV